MLLPCLRQVWPELRPVDEHIAIFTNCSHNTDRQQDWKHDVLGDADKYVAINASLQSNKA